MPNQDASKRSYFKGTVSFSYVSEEPLEGAKIETILEACDSGPAIMGATVFTEAAILRAEADRLATEYGSDETFFGERDEAEP